MPLAIPNATAAAFTDQAEPDAVDVDILVAAIAGDGALTGCAVTAQGTPNMTVAVASGRVKVGSTSVAVTAGNVTITAANATNPRFDLITVNNAGTLAAIAGTPSTNPVFPAIPADSVVLAAVYVPAGDTAINANQIVDKRATVGNPLPIQSDGTGLAVGTVFVDSDDAVSTGESVFDGGGASVSYAKGWRLNGGNATTAAASYIETIHAGDA